MLMFKLLRLYIVACTNLLYIWETDDLGFHRSDLIPSVVELLNSRFLFIVRGLIKCSTVYFINHRIIQLEITSNPLFSQVKDDIEKFKLESMDLENERKGILNGLEGKLTNSSSQSEAFDMKYVATMKTLDQLKSGRKKTIFKQTILCSLTFNHIC